ncbi:MAG: phage tail protein [Oscillibacter sp.]|nr:phage tail protein [Oscillibacter sp.]
MAYDIGPKIGIDGEAEFRKAINNINTNIRTLGTEMLAVTSAYDANDKSVAALTSRNEVLVKQIDAQKEKLAKLQEGLAAAAEKYGENDEKTQRWQQTVNKATADLNQMERQLAENNQSLEDLANQENEASESTRKVGDSMEETESAAKGLQDTLNSVAAGLASFAAAAGAAVAAAGAAVASFTKTAVENYAQSEQLVGGVETLFKESSGKVLEYANNAYKTAGMSANEYMESVTGFSASLLQGLGGDTEKAADIANLALVDMADNANKMGTDMASIQTAYQGFAKQNYSMLDNLKLGYGGTKDEMVRLINDSGILTEQISSLDNVSFDQIIEAIHAVQNNMGITGATAQEASTTIEGSLGAVKSAYGNLLSGIGSGGQNLDLLINNLVDSVLTAADNIVPVVETVLANMGAAISALTPIIADELPQMIENILPSMLEAGVSLLGGLAEGITSALPVLTQAALSVVEMLTSGIMELLPQLAEASVGIIATLAQGLADSLPELVPTIVDVVLQIVDTLTDPDNLDNVINAALEIITALAEGLIKALPKLAERVPQIIANIVTTLAGNLPKITESALKIISTLASGLIQAIPTLVKSIPQLVTSIVNGFTSNGPKFLDIGKNIVKGIWDGISELGSWLKDKVSGFLGGIVDSVKGVLGIHSPSKVFAGIGGYMAEGLGEGFEDEIGAVQRQIDRSMQELAGNASADVKVSGNVAGQTSGGIDSYLAQLPELIATAVHKELEGMAVNLNLRKVGEMTSQWQNNQARAMGV